MVPVSGADEFFSKLRDAVDAMERRQTVNPDSVELVVASAKRLLSRPDGKIGLDEILGHQGQKLAEAVDDDRFKVIGRFDEAEFISRSSAYESLSEPLARMAGILGRWGDGSEFETIHNLLQILERIADKEGNGLTAWIALRSYPAVLIYSCYAIGLTRAGRWRELNRLLSLKFTGEDRTARNLLERLHLSNWRGDNALWQVYPGLSKHKAAFTQHLWNLLTVWSQSFIGFKQEMETVALKWELVSALFSLGDTTAEETALLLQNGQFMHFLPLGLLSFKGDSRVALLEDLENGTLGKDLRANDFPNASAEMIPLFSRMVTSQATYERFR